MLAGFNSVRHRAHTWASGALHSVIIQVEKIVDEDLQVLLELLSIRLNRAGGDRREQHISDVVPAKRA